MRGVKLAEDVREKLLRLVADGMTKTKACELLGIHKQNVANWVASDEVFAAKWRKARTEQVHSMADRMLEIADEPVSEMAEVQRNKLRIETMKWVVSKWAPRLYGEKLKEDHTQQQAVILLPAVDGSGGLRQIALPPNTMVAATVTGVLGAAMPGSSSSNGNNGK